MKEELIRKLVSEFVREKRFRIEKKQDTIEDIDWILDPVRKYWELFEEDKISIPPLAILFLLDGNVAFVELPWSSDEEKFDMIQSLAAKIKELETYMVLFQSEVWMANIDEMDNIRPSECSNRKEALMLCLMKRSGINSWVALIETIQENRRKLGLWKKNEETQPIFLLPIFDALKKYDA